MDRQASAVSTAPRNRLWSVVCDVTRWPEHLATFDDVMRVNDGTNHPVGQRFRVRQPGLLAATYEITEWTEGVSFTWVARTPGLTTTATHLVRPHGDGGELLLGVAWRGPLAPVVRLLLGARTQRMINVEAQTLARVAGANG